METVGRFSKGDVVTIIRGRKIPRGVTGTVLSFKKGEYGPQAHLLLDDGSRVWTSVSNLGAYKDWIPLSDKRKGDLAVG